MISYKVIFTQTEREELLRMLNKNLSTGKREYSIAKNDLIDNVGHEKERESFNFKGIVPEKYQDDIDSFLVDFFLGETDGVELIDYERTHLRFGDEITIETGKGGNVALTNIEPGTEFSGVLQ